MDSSSSPLGVFLLGRPPVAARMSRAGTGACPYTLIVILKPFKIGRKLTSPAGKRQKSGLSLLGKPAF